MNILNLILYMLIGVTITMALCHDHTIALITLAIVVGLERTRHIMEDE